MVEPANADIWRELERILDANGGHRKFTGRITLHCNEGDVLKVETNEIFRARQATADGRQELTESRRA